MATLWYSSVQKMSGISFLRLDNDGAIEIAIWLPLVADVEASILGFSPQGSCVSCSISLYLTPLSLSSTKSAASSITPYLR